MRQGPLSPGGTQILPTKTRRWQYKKTYSRPKHRGTPSVQNTHPDPEATQTRRVTDTPKAEGPTHTNAQDRHTGATPRYPDAPKTHRTDTPAHAFTLKKTGHPEQYEVQPGNNERQRQPRWTEHPLDQPRNAPHDDTQRQKSKNPDMSRESHAHTRSQTHRSVRAHTQNDTHTP